MDMLRSGETTRLLGDSRGAGEDAAGVESIDVWLERIQSAVFFSGIAWCVGVILSTLRASQLWVGAPLFVVFLPWWTGCVIAFICQLRVAIGACGVRLGGRADVTGGPPSMDMSALPVLMQLALQLVCTLPVVLLLAASLLLYAAHLSQQEAAIAESFRAAQSAALLAIEHPLELPAPKVQLAQAAAPLFALEGWACVHCLFFRSRGVVSGASALLLLVGTVLLVLRVQCDESLARFRAAKDGMSQLPGPAPTLLEPDLPLSDAPWALVLSPLLVLLLVGLGSVLKAFAQQCSRQVLLSRAQLMASVAYLACLVLSGAAALLFFLGGDALLAPLLLGCGLVFGLTGVLLVTHTELSILRLRQGYSQPLPLAQTADGYWAPTGAGPEGWLFLGEVARRGKAPLPLVESQRAAEGMHIQMTARVADAKEAGEDPRRRSADKRSSAERKKRRRPKPKRPSQPKTYDSLFSA